MKRIVILQHGPSSGIHGQLANQLWNFISIYAYGVERSVPVRNYSFFEYARFFTIPVGNRLIDLLFFRPYSLLAPYVAENILIPVWRLCYKLFVLVQKVLAEQDVLYSGNAGYTDQPFYLPPSAKERAELLNKEKTSETLYFDGWLFRNPAGITKHREAIHAYFAPKKESRDHVAQFLSPLRARYERIIGVHMRQGDYRTWKGGAYFVAQDRVREILDEYLRFFGTSAATTCFVLASDGPIDTDLFEGLQIAVAEGTAVEDLFLLAETDAVIGSDSSFGDFAAYYGNVPHIVFQNGPMDWEYYRDKKEFFENTYCTLVHY